MTTTAIDPLASPGAVSGNVETGFPENSARRCLLSGSRFHQHANRSSKTRGPCPGVAQIGRPRMAVLARGCGFFIGIVMWLGSSAAQQPSPDTIPSGSQGHDPALQDFPTEKSTGVPNGLPLKKSPGLAVTVAGTVLDGMDIHGQVYIKADNVTIQNSRISARDFYVVRIDQGIKGTIIQNCDIDGQGRSGNGIGGAGMFLNNDIRGVENGINVEGGIPTAIKGNLIHGFRGEPSAHYDGIQVFGGNADVTISHNTIINDGNPGGVSAVFVANTFGPVSNVMIRENYLAGGGFPLYFDGTHGASPMTNVSWIQNYVVKGGYGYEYIKPDSQGHLPESSNNTKVEADNRAVSAPERGSSTRSPRNGHQSR